MLSKNYMEKRITQDRYERFSESRTRGLQNPQHWRDPRGLKCTMWRMSAKTSVMVSGAAENCGQDC